MKNKKVLVTGGAGFIGSHLVEKLVELGANVTVLDNLSTGSLTNLQKVSNAITFIKGDIKTLNDCLSAARDCQIIFHLAAHVSVPESLQNPKECYETNVIGTLHMLEAARQNSIKRFIFSSSAAVYGPKEELCHEESICQPESPYGHSKLIGELLCQDYWHDYGVQTICLRYFNVFGNRQNPHGSYAAVVCKFKQCMQQNKPITIFGDGLQTRDFIGVDSVVDANIQLAMSADHNAGTIFNIGTGQSISLLELITQLKKEFPFYVHKPIFKPARQGDIKHSRADCSKYQMLEK